MKDQKIRECKVMVLRETIVPYEKSICDNPEKVVDFWNEKIVTLPSFLSEQENFFVFCLNTRRRITDYFLVTIGTLDQVVVHSREVFRGAIIRAASGVVLVHNHPSGDPTPSEADVKVTKDLIRAGQVLKIELTDHIITGQKEVDSIVIGGSGKGYRSMRELGYLYT